MYDKWLLLTFGVLFFVIHLGFAILFLKEYQKIVQLRKNDQKYFGINFWLKASKIIKQKDVV